MKFFSLFLLLFVIPLVAANHVGCGDVFNSITLDSPVSSEKGCFVVQKDNIIIDCAQHVISYATHFGGYGINFNGHSGVTIRNCFINGNTTVTSSWAVWMSQGSNNVIERSTIVTNGKGAGGVYMDSSSQNTIRNANIVTYNENSDAIRFHNVHNTYLSYNQLQTYHSFNSHGLKMTGMSYDNVLSNLFFDSVNHSIIDETGNDNVNFFRYSNNYGDIRWLDNGSGSFPRNLTLFARESFGLDTNIVIGKLGAAVNLPVFTDGKIDSGVLIRFVDLPSKVPIVSIQKTKDYIVPPQKVKGYNCVGQDCSILSTGKVLRFNSTDLGSFMVVLKKK